MPKTYYLKKKIYNCAKIFSVFFSKICAKIDGEKRDENKCAFLTSVLFFSLIKLVICLFFQSIEMFCPKLLICFHT